MEFRLNDLLLFGLLVVVSGLAGTQTAARAQELMDRPVAAPRIAQPKTNLTSIHGPQSSTEGRAFVAGAWDLRPQSYMLLARPAKSEHDKQRQPSVPPTLQELPVQPYAYGWFGATMNRHPRRSFGARKSYTQWSFE